MADNDLGNWFRGIPIVTRWWFALSIIFPLLGRFGLIHAYYMILNSELVFYKFQIWRLFTCLVFYPINPRTGFHYLINLFFLYTYSVRLETGTFHGVPADYLFMIIFNSILSVIVGLIMEIMFLMDPLVLSVLYIWCQLNRDQIVTFWFGMQFPAMYLPWVLAGFNMIIGGGGLMELVGIFIGHVYFFLMFKYPQDFGGRRFLSTPSILYKYLPSVRGGRGGFGQAPETRRRPDDNQRGGFPGGGNRLGE